MVLGRRSWDTSSSLGITDVVQRICTMYYFWKYGPRAAYITCVFLGAPLVAQTVNKQTNKKNLPAMQETWVQSLGQEDPLEKEMVTHSSILA